MRLWLIFLGLMFANMVSLKANATFDSLYQQADIVILLNVLEISEGITDDVGTENFYVKIKIDSIYKLTKRIQLGEQFMNWQVSNLICKQSQLRRCVTPYLNGRWIFFLKRSQFAGTEPIHANQIQKFTPETSRIIRNIEVKSKRVVDHYYRHKTCNMKCTLCKAIEYEDWNKVRQYLKQQAKGQTHDTLLNHRRVKWAFSYRSVNASLPAFTGTFFLFKSATRDIHAYASYQLGYIRQVRPAWLSFVAYKIGGSKLYSKLRKETIDTTIFKNFVVDSNYSSNMIFYEKVNCSNMLTDTLKQHLYPTRMPLTDELVLLELVFEDELKMYMDYQTMPDYYERAFAYINTLKQRKNVYLLCMMTTHTVPEIAIQSMKALKEIDDARCIPFLLQLAKYKSEQGIGQTELSMRHEDYIRNLTETLDALTGCFTEAQSVPQGVSGNLFDLSLSIPIWESRIRILDDHDYFFGK